MVILAGTPIGDTASASPRLVQTLQGAQVIAAEDTRRLTDLLHRLQISTSARIVSYFEGNEAARTQELVEVLLAGQDVVVVTDAGMPSVSDPGFRLVSAAIEHGVRVTSVPGPTAVTTALAISGMPTDRFCFEGFLPRKRGERRRRLQELVDEPRTTVLYEAPHRVADLLHDAVEILGAQRHAAICRELTKTYEEVHRGTLAQLRDWVEQGVRGEITLVLAGATAQTVSLADAVGMVDEVVADGEKTSRAVAGIAARTGLRRRELYDAFLAARRAGAGASQSGDGHAEAPDQPSAE
ncbi:Ribosomal RNA small subunit methyltransferase I [Cutibacterium granulosum]|uniref:Ribosomal RNA small subunit methyltransferase I n=2 Tax=Cutibacterium granulosum TaxID=33011 RepID=A0A239WF59_9ACTN|nr:16S rRNA (cytidine(1402)-2'-O)-methyltransferase [Cutibacterium granulosum]ERF64006.1 S-adenosylmethionine-dependent methyltransferase, YraL family protein [Cutibacterium granulosum TM11]KAG9060571.1 16S rRNA (cytidine(1402)-2'-O)-methyltransferase [Cutibacterium granulosum DSM 20700]SNV32736.1 Ribosomal RNA small subunit methyltransferase I [Cutibacterium granulosum]